MRMTTKVQTSVDRVLEERQSNGFRRHLGASVIGRECARELWYMFRWAKQVRHKARILRLFSRGDLEEERFVKWLRSAGVNVQDRDPETGKQFRVEAVDGHFGGSQDAKLQFVPDMEDLYQWIVGEFKTHNDKSFKELKKKKVYKAKFEHYVQMQIYMYLTGLAAALYLAINKNNDELYTELVYLDEPFARSYIDRAEKIIYAQTPPERISESPGWYKCKFCDFNDVCHNGIQKSTNCRTCIHSRPAPNAEWICTLYDGYVLSESDQQRGCTSHELIYE